MKLLFAGRSRVQPKSPSIRHHEQRHERPRPKLTVIVSGAALVMSGNGPVLVHACQQYVATILKARFMQYPHTRVQQRVALPDIQQQVGFALMAVVEKPAFKVPVTLRARRPA